jgi:hypothetical protein
MGFKKPHVRRTRPANARPCPQMHRGGAAHTPPAPPPHSWALENQSEPELHHSLVTVIVIDAGYGTKGAVGDSRIKLVRNRMV